jgi:hypothetical protein
METQRCPVDHDEVPSALQQADVAKPCERLKGHCGI